MNRRRFLALSAAACLPCSARAESWTGTGLGAALTLRLEGGSPAQTARAFARIEGRIAQIESMASLHRDSALTRLNRDGRLAWPSTDLMDLLSHVDQVHRATGGAFDPTVQPVYLALASGQTPDPSLIGWNRVRISRQEIRLDPGQALTLNGIAQGWAADRIAEILREEGFGRALIDMGEVQALGRREDGQSWRAEIASAEGKALAEIALENRALATSSPMGTCIGAGLPHILGPEGQRPQWATVAVSAASAALADALSTAFCLMRAPEIEGALARFPDARLEVAA